MNRLQSLLACTIFILTTISSGLYAQEQTKEYAYISIEGKLFSKKLNVIVDLGDTPEQIKQGEELSSVLSNKKSFAAVLNHMVANGFELIQTIAMESGSSANGTGYSGTTGIVFIMRKEK